MLHSLPPKLLRSGELEAELSEGDHVVFISTLHGG